MPLILSFNDNLPMSSPLWPLRTDYRRRSMSSTPDLSADETTSSVFYKSEKERNERVRKSRICIYMAIYSELLLLLLLLPLLLSHIKETDVVASKTGNQPIFIFILSSFSNITFDVLISEKGNYKRREYGTYLIKSTGKSDYSIEFSTCQ